MPSTVRLCQNQPTRIGAIGCSAQPCRRRADAPPATLHQPALRVAAARALILREHRKRQMEERFAAGSQWRETGLVFTTSLGGPIEPRNVNRMFHRLCEKAGVPQVRLHDLRHSCATLLFTMGVDAATVQRILQHSSIGVTTGTYVEVIESVKREALDSWDSLFGPADDTAM
ncbi:tyrosine-type recombinase/integrase [Nocardia paucivorans]|uniref:tyrosine-type recombinase/integrase n=1 Tax=Nocardia paucivorans TaxID=114259 RepID=UPI001FE0EFE4|nr:tyrosine-type recombinase/integrase [Nocardia paucivorans]